MGTKNRISVLLIVLVFTLFACNYQRNKPGFNAMSAGFEVVKINDDESVVVTLRSGETKTLQKEQLDYTFVESVMLRPYCATCHTGPGASGQHDLSVYSSAMKFVTPESPEQSRLYMSVKDGSMPKSGPKPKDLELQTVAIWIKYGAREKAGEAGGPPAETNKPDPSPEITVAVYDCLNRKVFVSHCNNCHKNFHSYEKFLTHYPTQLVLANPRSSNLYHKMAETHTKGERMPPKGFPDEATKRDALKAVEECLAP